MSEIDLHKMARRALVDASGTVYGAPAEDGPRYVFTLKALESFYRQAIVAERERCARVCDQYAQERDQNAAGAEVCAAAIRRG